MGHHVFAIQEAHADLMLQLNRHKWVLQQDQCLSARKPNKVQTSGHGRKQKIWWHVAEVFFARARLGLKSLVIMSLHLSSIYAKRPVAGPQALQEVMDVA